MKRAVNKGRLAEIFVGLERVRNANPQIKPSLHYWHRESRGSRGAVLPIEVKAGSAGKMRSLHLFLEERDCPRGVRISLENYSRYGKIETHPLYAVWCLEPKETPDFGEWK